jgi:hypothetical protein
MDNRELKGFKPFGWANGEPAPEPIQVEDPPPYSQGLGGPPFPPAGSDGAVSISSRFFNLVEVIGAGINDGLTTVFPPIIYVPRYLTHGGVVLA